MKLLIVESPNKIATLSKIVGPEYEIIASFGHIRDLSKNYKDGIGINLLKNFTPKFTIMPDKIQVIQNILDHAERASEVIIATDPDREGEAISFHINECIKGLNKPVSRISFIEITKDAVLKAVNNPGKIDMNMVNSQIARRVLDRIVGYMVSPYLMGKYKRTLSAGRVQSVATRMVIERESEISSFKPKEYWNIFTSFSKNGVPFKAKLMSKVSNQEEAAAIKSLISLPDLVSPNFEIASVVSKERSEIPKPPLNTSKMQQVMANKFGMDGETCMAKAQTLYERGFITYIRTDSVKISDTALSDVREYLIKKDFPIPKSPHFYADKDGAQGAHECIRPTNLELIPDDVNLHPDENKLYRVIWEQFVSSQMMPAIYDTMDVRIEHIPSKTSFRVAGKALKFKGYLEFSNSSLGVISLPLLQVGESLALTSKNPIQMEQKFTKPPSRYSYATLIEELENKGVGRPSTFANICKTITSRSYVENKENTFYGTELGLQITTELEKYFKFMEYDYTAKLETQLDEIADGKITGTDALNGFYGQFKEKLNQAHIDNGGVICAGCHSPVYHKTSKEGREYDICSLFPFCRYKNSVDIKMVEREVSHS